MASITSPPENLPMGATIIPPTSPKPAYNPHDNNPSTTSLAHQPTTPGGLAEEEETYDPTSTDPFSPFYCHRRASESRSRLHLTTTSRSQSYSHSRSQSYHSSKQQPPSLLPPPEYCEKDLEKGINITTNAVAASKSTTSLPAPAGGKRQCKQSLLCKSEAKKAGGWWRMMSKRRKLAVQAVIAVLIVGAVTGLGIGVSKAMGTGVWKNSNSSSAGIGEDS